MIKKSNTCKDTDINIHEGASVLQFFRLLTDEEQRIAYAILKGMRLQKGLDSQGKEQTSTAAGA